jgi:hypothetical protein
MKVVADRLLLDVEAGASKELVLHVLVPLASSLLSCFTYTPILCRSIDKSCSCFSFI